MAMCSRIIITDDQHEEIYIHLDGQLVYTANHDEHGWDGMTAVIELVEKIAAALGLRVENTQDIV
jgi:hypothetical protein